jgi:hypothetical protein
MFAFVAMYYNNAGDVENIDKNDAIDEWIVSDNFVPYNFDNTGNLIVQEK